MKKSFVLILAAAMLLCSACGGGESQNRTQSSSSPTVNDVLKAGTSETGNNPQDLLIDAPSKEGSDTVNEAVSAPAEEVDTAASADAEGIPEPDIDLTAMSSTMVYAEVLNMVTDPEPYLGKTIKASGPFASYHDESTGNDYYACIVQDATACCSEGIEFVLAEGYEYPKEGETVTVQGTLDAYVEGEYLYITLRDAVRIG